MKVAVVHDWLIGFNGGAERVLKEILVCFPEATLFSLIDFLDEKAKSEFNQKPITSFLQKLPLARKWYRFYLWLMPLAVEQLDLAEFDVVISSSHAVAKGVKTSPDQFHLAYVHSPMRYIWDLEKQYFAKKKIYHGIGGFFLKKWLQKLRTWDVVSSFRVDCFVANSSFVRKRIHKYYRREASVIHPPVNLEEFPQNLVEVAREDYYLFVGRLEIYKKADLVIEAFKELKNQELVIIGNGSEYERLRKDAQKHSNIKLLGSLTRKELIAKLSRAKALIFPALEDFGIVMLEAHACGIPVIAYKRGGALDIVAENKTGVFFKEQSQASLLEAISFFEQNEKKFNQSKMRKRSLEFSNDKFRKKFKRKVLLEYKKFLGKND